MIGKEAFGVSMHIVEQAGTVWNNSGGVMMTHHGVPNEALFLVCVVK